MFCRACGTAIDGTDLHCANCTQYSESTSGVPNVKRYWIPIAVIVLLFIVSLINIVKSNDAFGTASSNSVIGGFLIYLGMAGEVALGIGGIMVSFRLFKRKPDCLKQLRNLLIANVCCASYLYFLAGIARTSDEFVAYIFRNLIFSTVCFFYFKKSTTVRQIYGLNL